MSERSNSPGPLEKAVQAHHPTQAVLYEARALDRELQRSDRSCDVLLHGIESFVMHYASVLLHETESIGALGRGCLEAVRSAPAVAQRARAASLLVALLAAVAGEVEREGIGRVRARVPRRLSALVRELARQDLPFDRGLLVPPMLEFGQQLVMMADEGRPPGLWYDLLAELDLLLLAITRRRVAGEPSYDGRWDAEPESRQLAIDRLEAVRAERIEADLAWLDELEQDARAGLRTGPEVFLELSAYENRDERERAWQAWLDQVASQAAAGAIEPGVLRGLCQGLADWITRVEDRSFLAALASALVRTVPTVLDHGGEQALDVALRTFGQAIASRLEREAGQGEVGKALEDLRRVAAGLVERAVSPGGQAPALALRLGPRLRTGPVTGQPASCEDVLWRLGLAGRLRPAGACRCLLGLVAGFCLERIDLVPRHFSGKDAPATADLSRCLVDAMAGMLGRAWPDEVLWAVRALLRVAPLSPLQLAGPSCRAALRALAPGEYRAAYLYDLKERIQNRPGPENLLDVERVLGFWQDGREELLDGLACPDSLASLAAAEPRDRQIRRLLANLAEHAPVPGKEGVRWLSLLPGTFYDPDSLAKLAGFEGLDPEALVVLVSLLRVYRALVDRYHPTSSTRLSALGDGDLLARADAQLEERRQSRGRVFGAGGLAGLDAFARLERFGQDLALAGELDDTLEELARRSPDAVDPAGVLGRMLLHARLSGLGAADAGELAGLAGRAHSLATGWRLKLADSLRPHVFDSLRRLRDNPLARPAAAWRRWFETHRESATDRAADDLAGLLADDLLAADGGALLLADFSGRYPG